MEKQFRRNISSLDDICQFVAEFFASTDTDESHSFAVNLIIEELFTNMVKYSPESSHDIHVQLERLDAQLLICLTDFDVESFDVTQAPPVDINQPVAERKIGGLGLHFVREMSDDISYEYKDRTSKITVTKGV